MTWAKPLMDQIHTRLYELRLEPRDYFQKYRLVQGQI
jgi:hypothetical protein